VCSFALLIHIFNGFDVMWRFHKGLEMYQGGEYGDAEVLYADAQRNSRQPNWRARYNLANAYYKQERYTESVKMNQSALALAKGDEKFSIYYNLGNAYFMLNNLQLSAKAYQDALIIKNDDDARRNLLMIWARIAEMPDKKPQDDNDSKDQSNHNSDDKGEKVNDKPDDKKNELTKENIDDLLKMIRDNEENSRSRISNKKTPLQVKPANGLDY
jgi:tetratricopeptide (TPR) repeat protein